MVYEGARSIIGPYLATLGASAAVVGIAAGAGRIHRLRPAGRVGLPGPAQQPLLGLDDHRLCVDGAQRPADRRDHVLAPALVLYGTERLGKAVRSPAKDTLLSHASTQLGRGTAFGVHQAMDQLGAVLGPLLLAAVLAWRDGDYRLAFGVLLVPGVLALGVLAWLCHRVPDPSAYESADLEDAPAGLRRRAACRPCSGAMWPQSPSCPAVSPRSRCLRSMRRRRPGVGRADSGAVRAGDVCRRTQRPGDGTRLRPPRRQRAARVPVAACAAALAFSGNATLVWIGMAVWGLVNGVLDSTVKAVVAELVARRRPRLGIRLVGVRPRGGAAGCRCGAGHCLRPERDARRHLILARTSWRWPACGR